MNVSLRTKTSPQEDLIKGKHVVIFACEQTPPLEYGCILEIFGSKQAKLGPCWYRLSVAALSYQPVETSSCMLIVPDGGLELLNHADIVIIPGWSDVHSPIPETLNHALCTAHGRGARLVAFGSGVFALAAAGLLYGKRCTTHWQDEEAFRDRYSAIHSVPNILYTDAGDILTSAGGSSALDLCLHIVRSDFGSTCASEVAKHLIMTTFRNGDQSQYYQRLISDTSDIETRIAKVLNQVITTLGQEWPIERLATNIGVSTRVLHRLFNTNFGVSPGAWIIQARLDYACELLRSTKLSIEAISATCGLKHPNIMRHHFREKLGMNPKLYRAQFKT